MILYNDVSHSANVSNKLSEQPKKLQPWQDNAIAATFAGCGGLFGGLLTSGLNQKYWQDVREDLRTHDLRNFGDFFEKGWLKSDIYKVFFIEKGFAPWCIAGGAIATGAMFYGFYQMTKHKEEPQQPSPSPRIDTATAQRDVVMLKNNPAIEASL